MKGQVEKDYPAKDTGEKWSMRCRSNEFGPFCVVKGLNMFHVSLGIRTRLSLGSSELSLVLSPQSLSPNSHIRKQHLLIQPQPAQDGNLKINGIDKGFGLATDPGRQENSDTAWRPGAKRCPWPSGRIYLKYPSLPDRKGASKRQSFRSF